MARSPFSRVVWLSAAVLLLSIGAWAGLTAWRESALETATTPVAAAIGVDREVTYHQDIAPLMAASCAACHRPGQSAPFSLLNFTDARKRAQQIAAVTKSRFMPPWLPEPGYGNFVGDRHLSERQVELFQRWAAAGAPEGPEPQINSSPTTRAAVQETPPDLRLELPAGYVLPAEGRDIYRNFVISVPLDSFRRVKAVKVNFHGSPAVHHAFVLVDRTGSARRLDARDSELGYPGMSTGEGVAAPAGHFLSWQPGKQPEVFAEGSSWRILPGSDLVLQLHMRPTGKPEPIRATIDLHFTEDPPTTWPFRLVLRSTAIDIPPGDSNYRVSAEYTLPVDVKLTAVLPHVHYLGRELKAYAVLPDGSRQWIILIRNWDFSWQGDYRLVQPLALPKGTRLIMEYQFDNSDNNPQNPAKPPRRVRFGSDSTDEMAELWLQVIPADREELDRLASHYQYHWALPDIIRRCENELRHDPTNPRQHTDYAAALRGLGRFDEADQHISLALQASPAYAPAFRGRALIQISRGRTAAALQSLETAHSLDPDNASVCNDLAYLYFTRNELGKSADFSRQALALSPTSSVAYVNLARIALARNDREAAMTNFRSALRVDPDDFDARRGLGQLENSR